MSGSRKFRIRSRKIILVVVALGGTALCGWETTLLFHFRDKSKIDSAYLQSLERELADVRRQKEDADRDAQAAARDLAELSPPPSSAEESATRDQVNAWLGRINRLKKMFAQRPEQTLPEMRLLTDEDWLRATRWSSLDGGDAVREALASVRNAATGKFAEDIAAAARAYQKANGDQDLVSVAALGPYLNDPSDSAILSRYEMTDSPIKHAPYNNILESSTVDPEYDNRISVQIDGAGWQTMNPTAWIPDFPQREQKAYASYHQHEGFVALTPQEVLPYFDPPLDPPTQARLIQSLQQDR